MAGLAASFGSGAMTNSINEMDDANCILAIGTNTTAAHPIIGLHVKKAVRNGTKLIVANPKEIDLVRFADIFIQHRPGSDVALLMGMMRVIVDEGLHDEAFIQEHCEDFEVFKKSLEEYDLAFVQEKTGVPWEKIVAAARMFAENSPGSILYAMGITQHTHGTDNVFATANLAMLTGSIGKPSTGVNPLRGQNNVQGACDMGGLPNVYPGYQKVTDPAAKAKFEAAWGVELDDKVGLTHTEIFDEVLNGRVKALYMMGENPALSEANASHAVKAMEELDFFVVQDIFMSESARFADVILPAASYAEKDGTFTNTERRVQRVRRAIEPVGDARPDWWIACEIAKRMGVEGFDFENPREIMQEIASLTPSYGGISYERIEEVGLQWPCPTEDHPGTPYLHKGKFALPGGKGVFHELTYKPSAENPDKEFPLLLTTDRSLYHYHTATMTRRVEGLEILDGEEFLKINPKDAEKFGLDDGEMVKVISRRGETPVRTKVTRICPPGVVSMTFHFHESPTNMLTNDALDPVAKIPETKVAAVRIEKMNGH
ncbi:MAG: molybdopterin-dependent oxidoreductase [Anaerolineales bacterium]|nr:molybdopterin-dependent oxidoreductase [Anaerolineales bacterium]